VYQDYEYNKLKKDILASINDPSCLEELKGRLLILMLGNRSMFVDLEKGALIVSNDLYVTFSKGNIFYNEIELAYNNYSRQTIVELNCRRDTKELVLMNVDNIDNISIFYNLKKLTIVDSPKLTLDSHPLLGLHNLVYLSVHGVNLTSKSFFRLSNLNTIKIRHCTIPWDIFLHMTNSKSNRNLTDLTIYKSKSHGLCFDTLTKLDNFDVVGLMSLMCRPKTIINAVLETIIEETDNPSEY